MKRISVLVPCYNEVDNVEPLSEAILREFASHLSQYDMELVFIDNCSTDGTREKLQNLCAKNKTVKAIFNAKNFGWINSPYYGICQLQGDCVILISADFQDPVEMIPTLVKEWEKGYKIVSCIKVERDENPIMSFIRTCYYKVITKMSSVEQIEHFTGFGLYDQSFIQVLRDLKDPTPWLRGIVAELGGQRISVPYHQNRRCSGSSHANLYTLYDTAMLSFTSYTKVGLRLATMGGFLFSALTMLVAIAYFIAKLVWWEQFPMGMAPVVIGLFFLGAVQLFFLGLLGEYILSINVRVMKRPLVVEEKRLNFD